MDQYDIPIHYVIYTVAVFIATYLWPNVSAMILYELDLGTFIFINTSCRTNILL